MKDRCILCGAETAYDETTHIDNRVGYIEGAGQLCINCYKVGTNFNHIPIPVYVIETTPNDMELGQKVRRMYYESK